MLSLHSHPSRLLFIWLCLAGGLVACEGPDRRLDDADAALGDASGETDAADDPLARPQFPPAGGDREAYDELVTALTAQSWQGVTLYAERISPAYEVVFDPGGTYRTRCFSSERCEPFGVGSDGDNGYRWELSTLNAGGNGRGELRSRAAGFSYGMELDELRYSRADRALSFVLREVPLTSTALALVPVALVLLTTPGSEADLEEAP